MIGSGSWFRDHQIRYLAHTQPALRSPLGSRTRERCRTVNTSSSENEILELRFGPYAAVISSQGAALQTLRYEQRDLVLPFEPRSNTTDFRGVICAPWPNRLADGRYRWDGREIQADTNEPDRRNALHGMVFDRRWSVIAVRENSLTLATTLSQEVGYPFELLLQVTYALGPAGLTGTIIATNTGTKTLPYGSCPHPYLVAGDSPMHQWVVTIPADSFLETSPDRLLPLREVKVEGSHFDFRRGEFLQGIRIDHAFTKVNRGSDGLARVTLREPSGTGVELAFGQEWPWLQICTGSKPELGLAVEPMTCPPDAFNNRLDIVLLGPGESHRGTWFIRALH
ncbi:aldose 1-epimerase family protein [Paenarthrobacter sp. NPDC089714]|uniref:aldose 1-epimerase family protein n=1 Tax=Paenarthrobacter sp. NPDC089714 TaxID=3364377 RepID=UPI00381BD50A